MCGLPVDAGPAVCMQFPPHPGGVAVGLCKKGKEDDVNGKGFNILV